MNMPNGVIREIDCDLLREQARAAKPFKYILIDDFLDTDFAHDALRSWPSYEDAVKMGKGYPSINERKKFELSNSAQYPQPLRELNEALASPPFLETVSSIFEIPNLLADPELVGGGLHQTGPCGHLDVHVDFNYIAARKLHRRLNILIYFNEGWAPEWGGQLELWNQDVSERIGLFDPIFNRCVIFETSEISYHGVTKVTCPKDVVRRSFAGYYYTTEAPAHWTGKSHSTIFKARPEESVKKQIMAVRHASDMVKGKLKQVIRRSAI
ncbi:MAG TPA: 2OG-Fe(II) oxygenase [Mycobacterium sp.]|uniref:2OG-Fe(II) oxygenase n=1 Tax=Mycobacterium sp. TaxID=1785 RepID=UPI002CE181F8|nr:2OG-Fe(II) oxygenase [Mycobacterium sp.]HME74270.1 2OG-Fe(II) oxygenase [Mycobacterium sp.]